MLQTRRRIFGLARRGVQKQRQQRRYESSEHGTTTTTAGAEAHHAPPHHHNEPVNESLGRGFYITLAAIPFSLALYKFSTSSDADSGAEAPQPLFTRLISSYSNWGEKWKTRNAMHTAMVEQAAHDRNLFQSSPGSKMIDLKFPEVFNTGSPYNVPAGHGADLSALIAHYEQRNRDTEEKKINKLREAERIKEAEAAAAPAQSEKKFFGIF